jgi:hypothetical protein
MLILLLLVGKRGNSSAVSPIWSEIKPTVWKALSEQRLRRKAPDVDLGD